MVRCCLQDRKEKLIKVSCFGLQRQKQYAVILGIIRGKPREANLEMSNLGANKEKL